MRVLRKGIAVALCAAMVITLAPAGSADAAKKPKLNKSKASVEVGKTVKLTVKNGKKKAKVTWKTNKKAIATVAKVKKAKKASANVKGVKEGKAKITATYKLGKTKKKLTCTVTVTAAKPQTNVGGTPTAAVNNNVPNPNGGDVTVPSQGPSDAPKPSATPKPSPTPSNVPKNGSLSARQLAAGTSITIDGTAGEEEAWIDVTEPVELLNDKTKQFGIRGGETTDVTSATAKLMWSEDSFYVLVDVAKANAGDADSVTVYLASDAKADKVASVKVPAGGEATDAKSTKTDAGYVVEAKLALSGKAVGDSVVVDIQINEGDKTVNYFDTRYKMVYDAEADKWNLEDNGVKAGEDASVLGSVELLNAMAQPTVALHTDKEAEIIEKAAAKPAGLETYPGAHTMTWVDTTYWTDVYKAANMESIVFANSNIPEYKGNAEKVGLNKEDRNSAQAYTIWSENYLYVLYDINDKDIAPESTDHYDTDSVEFFLDEDFNRPTAYSAEGDEIQIRVDAINSAFSCKNTAGDDNDASISEGTAPYDMIAYAVKYKHDSELNDTAEGATGYMVEMIIKLKSTHKAGDMMGMDLQINDCFTTEITDENGAVLPDSDRASTLTAYDTTNNGYQDPSCFGRIKLK